MEPARLLKKGDDGQDVEVRINAMVEEEEEAGGGDMESPLPFEQFLHGDSVLMDVRQEDDEKLIADETHSLQSMYGFVNDGDQDLVELTMEPGSSIVAISEACMIHS